jgi:hypothetical protein
MKRLAISYVLLLVMSCGIIMLERVQNWAEITLGGGEKG